MKTLVNGLLIASLLGFASLNAAVNPFAARTAIGQEGPCQGVPPGCSCCESCGCWHCDEDE